MNSLRQIGLGILATLVTVAILLGSLSLAFMENVQRQGLVPPATLISLVTLSQILSPTPTLSGTPAAPGSATPTISPTPSESLPASASPSASASPTPTGSLTPTMICRDHPDTWVPITVHDGDTLQGIAAAFDTTTNALTKFNCLTTNKLTPGQQLYVPGPPATSTPTPCVPYYPGWVTYTIQPGDTLTHLAQVFNVTVAMLMQVNCLPNSNIRAGDHLLVPFLPPTSTPVPTRATRTPQPTTPAPSNTPVPTTIPSDTPVPTPIPSDTPVPTPVPSDTPVPTAIPTKPPKPTPIPSDTTVPTVAFTVAPNESH